MPIIDKMAVSGGSNSAVVNGLNNFYVPENVEQKTDLDSGHITAQMSSYTRAGWTTKNWGVKRDTVFTSLKQFNVLRVSFTRKSRKEMENVLSAEQRKEEQTTMDKWLGGMRR